MEDQECLCSRKDRQEGDEGQDRQQDMGQTFGIKKGGKIKLKSRKYKSKIKHTNKPGQFSCFFLNPQHVIKGYQCAYCCVTTQCSETCRLKQKQ